ncbi:hypothetical protein B5E53_08045 [Eubacterium sp. An11]|nr:hypothetical protein B5E53_08045 [Eubacterium sp. An11]
MEITMQKDISGIFIESVLNKALKEINKSPRRTARNLIDMGVNFSKGHLQKVFLSYVQELLQNQNSAYYDLIKDVTDHVDKGIISTFGMNLGYNGCTKGVKRIREVENLENFSVPLSLSMRLDGEKLTEEDSIYQKIIRQGKALGIYVYLLKLEKGQPEALLPLLKKNRDCAFVLFVKDTDLSPAFLAGVHRSKNVMISVCADDKAVTLCPKLREENLLYAVYSYYSEENEDDILNGQWLAEQLPLRPYFALLIPSPSCKKETCHKVYDYILSVRNEQKEAVIAMDLLQDSWKINEMISEDSCDIGFNMDGSTRIYHKDCGRAEANCVENSHDDTGKDKNTADGESSTVEKKEITDKNIFDCSVEDILRSAVPRRQ